MLGLLSRSSIRSFAAAPTRTRTSTLFRTSRPNLSVHGYCGPYVPGYGQMFLPMPKVPDNLKGKWIIPFGMHGTPYLLRNDVFYYNMLSMIIGLFSGHYFYMYYLRPINPPNPPRDKADDLKMRPKVHPHTVADD